MEAPARPWLIPAPPAIPFDTLLAGVPWTLGTISQALKLPSNDPCFPFIFFLPSCFWEPQPHPRTGSTNKHFSLLPFNPISCILLPLLELLGGSAPPWPGSTIPQALKLPSKVLAEVLHCSGQPLAHRHHRDNQAFITLGSANKTYQFMLRWNKQDVQDVSTREEPTNFKCCSN